MIINQAIAEKAKEAYKKMKTLGIVVSILMILMGIAMFCVPARATAFMMVMMVVGLFLYGVVEIVVYCKMPKELREGSMLGAGILWCLIGLLLIIGGCSAPVEAKLAAWGTFEYIIAFMVGFSMFFSGFRSFSACSAVKAMGKSTAGPIIAGILYIIAGIVVLTYPIGSVITLTVFYGIYLLVGGVALLCRVLSH